MGERRFHLLQCPAATYNFTPINQCHLHAGNVTFALLNECLNKTLSCDEVRFASEILQKSIVFSMQELADDVLYLDKLGSKLMA